MPESIPATGGRPAGAPLYEPVVRLGTPVVGGAAVSHPNHPVLLPETEMEDEVPLAPARAAPQPHWYKGLVRPAAYLASGLAGAVLVAGISGLLRSGAQSSGNRGSLEAAAGAALIAGDTATLDRRADTLALAIETFGLRARLFDSHRMPCAGLARGLQQVEDGWLGYNVARKGTLAGADAARDARDRSLYADVRAVELRFERSSCTRP